MLLSLFCGSGGLDLGFEQAGFETGLAFDIHEPSIQSYNHNRPDRNIGHIADIREITLESIDRFYGGIFKPTAVIGGPPCQSFSRSNIHKIVDDPRSELLLHYLRLVESLHRRSPLSFVVMENVPEISTFEKGKHFERICRKLKSLGFKTSAKVLDAANFSVPQVRKRIFLLGLNTQSSYNSPWVTLNNFHSSNVRTVFDAIANLDEPAFFERGLDMSKHTVHPNHWCMVPKSDRFKHNQLIPGDCSRRSFRTLEWERPSYTVAYGNREVHVHPSGKRRLSVYEAMLLQGYPSDYVLKGTLSDQFQQVSQAVPPPMAKAIALSIKG